MNTRRTLLMSLLALPLGALAQTTVFDHNHAAWNALLKKHVRWLPDGKQSQVNYKGFSADRAALKTVLDSFSAVSRAQFDGWSRAQQMAFLINAYNAFTVELILTQYPGLKSIKDTGSFLQPPWKKKFFSLFGAPQHLDGIEHEQLRPVFKDHRIHAAVNCASIGCPALRDEAFTAAKLEAQLDDGMRRFMGDNTRNRVANGRLEVSAIFKWYREDFESGYQGLSRPLDVFARHADLLSDKAEDRAALREGRLSPNYLDYDWSLNSTGR